MSDEPEKKIIYWEDIETFVAQQKRVLEGVSMAIGGLQEEIQNLTNMIEECNQNIVGYKKEVDNFKAFLEKSPQSDPDGEIKDACTMLNVEMIKVGLNAQRYAQVRKEKDKLLQNLKMSESKCKQGMKELKEKIKRVGVEGDVDVDKIF